MEDKLMRNQPKQKQQKNSNLIIVFVALAIAAAALIYAQGQRQEANMAKYAAANNCEWSYNGSFYWDDRDYTCK